MEHLCFRFVKDGDNLAVALNEVCEVVGFGYHVGVFFKEFDASPNSVLDFDNNNEVRIKTLSDFMGNGILYRVQYKCKTDKPSVIKERAMDVYKHPKKHRFAVYSLERNNCQDFASYVTIGKRFSFEMCQLEWDDKIAVKLFGSMTKKPASK